jgi:hypothetical protein
MNGKIRRQMNYRSCQIDTNGAERLMWTEIKMNEPKFIYFEIVGMTRDLNVSNEYHPA